MFISTPIRIPIKTLISTIIKTPIMNIQNNTPKNTHYKEYPLKRSPTNIKYKTLVTRGMGARSNLFYLRINKSFWKEGQNGFMGKKIQPKKGHTNK